MSHSHSAGAAGPATPNARQWLYFSLLVTIFGTSFLFIKIGVETIGPITLVAARLSMAAMVLTVVMFAAGKRLPPLRTSPGLGIDIHWRAFAMLALMGNALPFTLISWGTQTVPSSLAGILMAIMPLTTMIFAALFVAGEHITFRRMIGFMMGFLGILVLFGAEALGLAASQPLVPQAVIIFGAICYAVTAILTKKMPPCDPLAAAVGIHICGAVMIWPVALVVEAPWTLEPNAASLASMLALALGSSAFCTILLLHLIRDVGPTFTSQLNYLVPVFAVVVGFIFLGEEPRWNALGALLLILTGIGVAQSRPTRRLVNQA